MPTPNTPASRLDRAAAIRSRGGDLDDLERAALSYAADKIRESGELVTTALGTERMADFVESLTLSIGED